MTRDPRRLTELQLHMHVAALLRRAAAPGVIWFHPANGEKRDKATAHKLQQMGVQPGVSDIVLMIPGKVGIATIEQSKHRTIAIASGKHIPMPDEPRVWVTPTYPNTLFVQPAFLELKGPSGRLSVEQREFLDRADSIGCLVDVASTPEAALVILQRWGALRPGTTSVTRRNPAEVA